MDSCGLRTILRSMRCRRLFVFKSYIVGLATTTGQSTCCKTSAENEEFGRSSSRKAGCYFQAKVSAEYFGALGKSEPTKVSPAYTTLRSVVVHDCRFFMVDRTRNGKELKEEFQVLGSTGNVNMGVSIPDKTSR